MAEHIINGARLSEKRIYYWAGVCDKTTKHGKWVEKDHLMDLDDMPALRNIRTQEFRFVTKVELTGRLVDMIDLSIDDESHSFVVNGTITHNSAGYNKYLRAIAKEKGYALSQNGLVDRETKKLISNKEKEIMSYLGVEYLPPNQRNY